MKKAVDARYQRVFWRALGELGLDVTDFVVTRTACMGSLIDTPEGHKQRAGDLGRIAQVLRDKGYSVLVKETSTGPVVEIVGSPD